jgi:hypothetical protein
MPEPHLRAADTDREAVARRLGEHMAVGRLTLEEYEERVGRAYEAKTFGDLARLTADLPVSPPAAGTAPATRIQHAYAACGAGPWGGPWHWGPARRTFWSSWLTTALIMLAIWLLTSISSGGLIYFWPVWVIGPWGAMLVARTLAGPPGPRDRRSRV